MVKNNLFLLYLITLLTSCNQKEYIRVDSNLVYQNILDTITIKLDSLGSKNIINEVLYSASDFANHKLNFEIKGEAKAKLLSEYFKNYNSFQRLHEGADFYKSNYIFKAQHLYCCGILNLNKQIESYLFLYIYDKGIREPFEICPIYELLLFNFKKNQLCSIVKVSSEIDLNNDLSLGLKSTIINKTLLSYDSIKTFDNKRYCLYTTYFIDDNGFIRFQWYPFNEISGYFK